MNKTKKSPLRIIGLIVMIIMFIAIIFILATSFVFKDSNSAPELFGYNIYIMSGTDMEPAIPDNAAVFSKAGPLSDDPVGSVALCHVVDNELTTVLRVAGVEEKDGATVYLMKSDKSSSGTLIKVGADKVIGQAMYVSKATGMILKFVTSQTGILILVIIPCAILLIIQLIAVLKKINERDEEESFSPAFTDDSDYREEDIDTYAGSEQNTFTKEIEPPPVVEEAASVAIIKTNEAVKPELVEKKAFEPVAAIAVEQKQEAGFLPEPEVVIEEHAAEIKAEAPKVELDRDGKAEYVRQRPTADVSELNKYIPPRDSQAVKASHSIDSLKSAIDRSKDTSGVLFDPTFRKKNDKEEVKNASSISPVKTEGKIHTAEKPADAPKQEEVFIAPRPKRTTTNKTLEELMKMLDQKDGK